jgi:hypothetical protein
MTINVRLNNNVPGLRMSRKYGLAQKSIVAGLFLFILWLPEPIEWRVLTQFIYSNPASNFCFPLLSWSRQQILRFVLKERQHVKKYETYSSKTNKMQRYTMVFITINALRVSGG